MNKLKKLSHVAALCAFLSASFAVQADEIQDANKLLKKGQHTQALEKVNAVLAGKPKDAQARFLKGLILTEQSDTTGAIKIFTELTNDYPELPEPYNNLAVLYAGLGQYEKAKIALEMAIRTHPSYATAHENLGDIYAKMASQAYDRALQLDKSSTSTQTKLAMIRDLFDDGAKPVRASRPTVATLAASKPVVAPAAPAPAPAAPAPTPAATSVAATPAVTASAPKQAEPNATVAAEVLQATRTWAAAWSAKDSARYLAFYAPNFQTPGGESRSNWEAMRKQRIAQPKSIRVEVRDTQVRVADAEHASISFRQNYRASHLNSTSTKTLEWVKTGGQWLIAAERTGR